MPAIKVLPVSAADVGLVHPVDGALAAKGSLWSYDAFTVRQLDAERIRRFEAGVDDATKSAAAPPAPTSAPPTKPAQAAEIENAPESAGSAEPAASASAKK